MHGLAMRGQWEFLGGSEGWYWRFFDSDTGSVLKRSRLAFATLFDSIKDAERHGYTNSGKATRVLGLAS